MWSRKIGRTRINWLSNATQWIGENEVEAGQLTDIDGRIINAAHIESSQLFSVALGKPATTTSRDETMRFS